MEQAKLAWQLLSNSTGSYSGRGVNHEGQNFTGNLSLEFAFPGKVLALSSTATGDNGEIYHAEKSWVGFEISGALILYVSSNNHPAITPHPFNRIVEKPGQKDVIFRFGNPDDGHSFREEITLSFYSDESAAHHYAWGLPGGKFEPRSGSKMNRLR